jgi:hypothetical protein
MPDLVARLAAVLPYPDYRSLPSNLVGVKRIAIEALRRQQGRQFSHEVALALVEFAERCQLKPVFESKRMYFLSYSLDYDELGEHRRKVRRTKPPKQRMHPVADRRHEDCFDVIATKWTGRFDTYDYLYELELLLPDSYVFLRNTQREHNLHFDFATFDRYLAPNYQRLLALLTECSGNGSRIIPVA